MFCSPSETEIVKCLLSGRGQDIKMKSLLKTSVYWHLATCREHFGAYSVVLTATNKLVGFKASSPLKVRTRFGTG